MLMNVMYYPRCIQRRDMCLFPFDKLAYFPPSPLPNCLHGNMVAIIHPLFRLSVRPIVLIYFILFVYISAMQCSLCFNMILRILNHSQRNGVSRKYRYHEPLHISLRKFIKTKKTHGIKSCIVICVHPLYIPLIIKIYRISN